MSASRGSLARTPQKLALYSLILALVILIRNSFIVDENNTENFDRRRNRPTSKERYRHRRLDSVNPTDGNNEPIQGEGGKELPPCNDVLLHDTTQGRCNHAKNCDGEYIMTTLLPLAFCSDQLSSKPILAKCFPMIFPVSLFLFTVLLFRLLGSTAASFFSPSLEMISTEFQIPPALAGVTLLALGNGSPDVSAVINAIKMNPSEGISLSLGELTGGAMFVQSVVVGRIVFLGSKLGGGKIMGVVCREELIRDITMYAISAGYVFWMCSRGVIFYHHVIVMLLLYCGYVAMVFGFEIRRFHSNSQSVIEADANVNKNVDFPDGDVEFSHSFDDDEEDQTVELSPLRKYSLGVHKSDPPGMKLTPRILRVLRKHQLRKEQQLMEKRKSQFVATENVLHDGSLQTSSSRGMKDRSWSLQLFNESLRDLNQHLYEAMYFEIWANTKLPWSEWCLLILESPFILIRKLVIPITFEVEYNRSLVAYSVAFSPFWLSFYMSTKLEDFDPFCIHAAGSCLPPVFWPFGISFAIGCAIFRYAPREGREDDLSMPLYISLPISLYGFVIAASWIDVISEQLVNVLEFIGVILRIPAPIMGMTVLAWGNSVGDYTTNGALAQRGLSEMSMAACFAGPSFNLLIGLGCGLLSQKESLLSNDGLIISLMPSVKVGFICLICNCVMTIICGLWYNGMIPKMHGYIFLAMYFAYFTLNAQNMVM